MSDDPNSPVAALSREQVLDRLVALLRTGARPDDPPQEAEAK